MGEILASLHLNGTLVAEILSFLILLGLLSRFVYGPLSKILKDRSDRVAQQLEDAENQREEAVRLQQDAAKALQAARQEARAIIEQAEKAGGVRSQEIIAEAREQAERQLEQAKASIRNERDQAVAELRREVADLALLVAGKVLDTSMDDKIQRKLVDDFVNEVAGAQ